VLVHRRRVGGYRVLISLFDAAVLLSSLSFIGYGISYVVSPHMKQEFVRFGLSNYGAITVLLQILGAIGLIVGFWFPSILILASGGLALMMFLGVGVRIKMKDSLLVSLPALLFFVLNTAIFVGAIRRTMT